MEKKELDVSTSRLVYRVFSELGYTSGAKVQNLISSYINEISVSIVKKAEEMTTAKNNKQIGYETLGLAIQFYSKNGHKRIYGKKKNQIKLLPCKRLMKELSKSDYIDNVACRLLQDYLTEQIYDIAEELHSIAKGLKAKKVIPEHFNILKEKLPL